MDACPRQTGSIAGHKWVCGDRRVAERAAKYKQRMSSESRCDDHMVEVAVDSSKPHCHNSRESQAHYWVQREANIRRPMAEPSEYRNAKHVDTVEE